jgi:hypothetical protein
MSDQAKRLSQLESYKQLCETRIKQLAPNHSIPLSELDLKTPPLTYYMAELKVKDNEISDLKKRISEIEERSRQSNSQSTKMKSTMMDSFPPNLENIPVDKMKESYSKLRAQTKELIDD